MITRCWSSSRCWWWCNCLLSQLQEKFGLDSVDAYRERITTAEPEQLLQWSKRILRAETPETIFH